MINLPAGFDAQAFVSELAPLMIGIIGIYSLFFAYQWVAEILRNE